MLRTDQEEMEDREDEQRFWHEWEDTGRETDCHGTVAKVAKVVVLIVIVLQSVIQSWI